MFPSGRDQFGADLPHPHSTTCDYATRAEALPMHRQNFIGIGVG